MNGDGYADLIIGAYYDDPNGSKSGASHVVFGKADGTAIELSDVEANSNTGGFVINGVSTDDESGYSVSGAGDVNGDGISDFLIGAPNSYGSGGSDEDGNGRAYLIYGSANLPSVIHVGSLGSLGVTFIGGQESGHFGYSVSGAGDFNSDGYSDLLIGAPDEEHGSSNSGAAYLIYGGMLSGTIDLKFGHSSVTRFKTGGNSDNVGHSVADLEDFDGDGHDDSGDCDAEEWWYAVIQETIKDVSEVAGDGRKRRS